ncbi:chemotaxis protein CheW [Leptospira sp. 96542]|nr:chemotaxis protein CheW [Leptospira sp. 96542]
MEKDSDWLLFKLRDKNYAILANRIKEILWFLPLSQSLLGGRASFATTTLRGEILYVSDLNLFWENEPVPYSPDSNLLVLEGNLAFPIDAIIGVYRLPLPELGDPKEGHGVWEERIWNGTVLSLLDASKLYPQNRWSPFGGSPDEVKKLDWFQRSYSVLGESIHEGLKTRIENSDSSLDNSKNLGLEPYSVVRVGEEYLSLNLNSVLEFSDPTQLTPVPNGDPLLHGFMNLRGDVLPVLSMANLIGLNKNNQFFMGKVVIVKEDEFSFGILVDELIDVIYKSAEERLLPPVGSRIESGGILESTFVSNDQFISVVSVSQILKKAKESLGQGSHEIH